MPGNQRQNAGPPEVEWLATGAEYRDTGAECRTPEQSTGTQEQNAGQRELNRRIWKVKSAQLWGLRAFTICFAAWATLRKGANLPDAAKGRAGRGRGAVSRTCTGRRARWLGILPFRVCRRGLRCCGFSPLRGARILSCLSQGT